MTSSYSQLLGMPAAVLGPVFFAVMLVLQLPAAWASTAPTLRAGRLLWGGPRRRDGPLVDPEAAG